ncbi:unnamed protein product [Allacma fusca]|uniref:Uncharacterized protein n=1 Tax=Allacma fusca TaxID=39272 RepID=A0A8J2MG66_9HEXA|nr:unnamed protein product [Allacma fusca]
MSGKILAILALLALVLIMVNLGQSSPSTGPCPPGPCLPSGARCECNDQCCEYYPICRGLTGPKTCV